MMIDIINYLIAVIGGILEEVISILPDSPFQGEILSVLTNYLGYINYVVPVGRIITFLSVYVSAVLTWYGVRYMFRIVRYID